MNPTEAVKFLTEAAWKNHTKDCSSSLAANSQCNCVAASHNSKVREALIVLGTAGRKSR